MEIKCNKCSHSQERFIDRGDLVSVKQDLLAKPCPSCGGINDLEAIEQDIIEFLEELTMMTGCRLEVLSGKTEEGIQLASLGKIGAILRYRASNTG